MTMASEDSIENGAKINEGTMASSYCDGKESKDGESYVVRKSNSQTCLSDKEKKDYYGVEKNDDDKDDSRTEPSGAIARTEPSGAIETWEEITKDDRTLSNKNLTRVVDHSMAILGERICEATNEHSFRGSLKAFERTLGRFRNPEIVLGKRIANGSFADIYTIQSFRRREEDAAVETYGTAYTQEQAESAEEIKRKKPSEYVVKVLRSNLLVSTPLFATAAADFLTEGNLLASVNHPHILAIRGRSVASVEGFSSGKRDSVFFVLERVDGTLIHKMNEWNERSSEHPLFAKSRRDSNITILRERFVAMNDLASALAYLHERRVIHRDISLSNVGISYGEGKVKLLDFGLAKVLPCALDENERFLLTGTTGSAR